MTRINFSAVENRRKLTVVNGPPRRVRHDGVRSHKPKSAGGCRPNSRWRDAQVVIGLFSMYCHYLSERCTAR
jgi:hypothetical protein